jgi:hypothetical protein
MTGLGDIADREAVFGILMGFPTNFLIVSYYYEY